MARFDAIASDLIGLGRSAKPDRALTVALQADVILALLGALGLSRAHILAHDLGDTVAQELLARQQEGASPVEWLSCVFLNGGLFPESHRPRLIQRLLASPLGPLIAAFSSEGTFRRNFREICSARHPPSEEFLRDSWRLLIENRGRAMLPRLLRYMEERRQQRPRWVGALERGDLPLRLINGALDPISGRHIAERYRELVPAADIVLLEDAGHYPHVELPAAVLGAFFDFHDALAAGDPA